MNATSPHPWAEVFGRARSLGYALGVTAALFLGVVPLSHWLANRATPVSATAPVSVVAWTPPAPEPPALLPALEVFGGALASGPALALAKPAPLPLDAPRLTPVSEGLVALDHFPVAAADVSEMPVFAVGELDRVPRLLSKPPSVLPYELKRDGVRGQVRLRVLIRPPGVVEVLEVVHADDERLVPYARRFAAQCRFETPRRDGLPVTAVYLFPITF